MTLGDEFAGTVDGVAYCVEPTVRCGECDQCRIGATQRCRGSAPHGIIGVAFDGGLADRVAVPADCLVPLPDDASLVEPPAVSCTPWAGRPPHRGSGCWWSAVAASGC